MLCSNCNQQNPDNQANCLSCGAPLPVSQVDAQGYQEMPPEGMQPPPPGMQPPPPGMQPPPPGMQPPPPGMQPPTPGMPFSPTETISTSTYPSGYPGGAYGPTPFDIPEIGRSGINEIIMGPEGVNEAPLFTSCFIAAIFTIITLVVLLPFRESQIYAIDVLVNRGFWPYAMMYNLWLGLVMIVWKIIGVQMIKGALKKPLIPPNIKTILPSNTDLLLQNIKSLYEKPRSNPLVYRLWMALLIFKQTSLVERVDAYCSQQSEAEGGNTEASYQIINFCLWTEPIFGFLGTVQGLGFALAGFGNIAGTAMEIDTIKGALASVTGGLSTAFDTTLLGLINSVIMMTLITLLKKDEEGFLSNVDAWIKENLMYRLKAPRVNLETEEEEAGGGGSQGKHFKKIIEETFQAYIQNLENAFDGWKEGFTGILGKLGEETGNMGEQFKSVEPIVTDFRAAMDEFSNKVEQTSENQKGLAETLNSQFAKLDPLITGFGQITENLNQERQQLDQQIKGWAKDLDEMAKNMAGEFQASGKEFLSQADQFQKQVNKNATQMSAVVGQKLIESGQGIINQFQQHMKEQDGLIRSQVDSLSKMTESLTQNMALMGENLHKKFESQTSGMDVLQNSFSKQIDQLERFANQFQNDMKSFAESQMRDIGSLSSKTTEGFMAQLTEWIRNFSQEQSTLANNLTSSFADKFNNVGQDVLGQFNQYTKMQGQNISQVMQGIKELQQGSGNLANQLSTSFNQLGQEMKTAFDQNLTKSAEVIQLCQSMAKDVSGGSGQSVQALSIVSTQLSALVDLQKEASQVMAQHASSLSASENTHNKEVEELQKLISGQQQLIQTLNAGAKNQTGNDSGITESLHSISAGIESLKPFLTELVELSKNSNKQEKPDDEN